MKKTLNVIVVIIVIVLLVATITNQELSTIAQVIIIIFIGICYELYSIRMKRENDKQDSINELKKSEEITKNGIIINVRDETEEFSLKKCPYCQELINKEATKCKHCGEVVGKGYEIIADGTYVSNKTPFKSNAEAKKGNLFFRVVWITVVVIFIWTVIQLGACAAIIKSLG